MGYHIKKIKRGKYGEVSKIQEELDELIDALEQNNKVMAMSELSDLYGAIDGYMQKHFPDFNMQHLAIMAEATTPAFDDGDGL